MSGNFSRSVKPSSLSCLENHCAVGAVTLPVSSCARVVAILTTGIITEGRQVRWEHGRTDACDPRCSQQIIFSSIAIAIAVILLLLFPNNADSYGHTALNEVSQQDSILQNGEEMFRVASTENTLETEKISAKSFAYFQR